MTGQQFRGSEAARNIRDFLASYDALDPSDREVAARIRERLQREIYRREREIYPEFVDLGGEGGEA